MDWASIRKVGRHLSSVRSALGANSETIPASSVVGYRRHRATTESAPSASEIAVSRRATDYFVNR